MALIKLDGFDEAVRRHTWRGNRLPVLFEGRRSCSRCGIGEVIRIGPFTQHALFADAGYGYGEEVTVDICLACAGTKIATLNAVRPPRRPK
jgi:hypothetical protein